MVEASAKTPTPAPARVRFDSLDAVRGLGAMVVVLWHWQHMTLLTGPKYTYPPLHGPDRTLEPFYVVLSPFYEFGFRAVDLFFVISGFVFYLLYERSIAEARTPAKGFFILRLSRLYPLHLLTLLLVAGVQFFFLQSTHQTFVYYGYDVWHFVKNLYLINAPNYSFNGPTWALTVEALLYLIFWPLARTGLLKGWISALLLTVVGLCMLLVPELSVWGRGLAGFFAGGLACRLYSLSRGNRTLLRVFIVLTALGWLTTLGLAYTRPPLGHGLSPTANLVLQLGLMWSMFYLLFPLTVIALALWDEYRAKPIPAFAWMGTISYTGYVLHFPMQLIIALAVVNGIGPRDFAYNPLAFIAFFVALFVIARAAYIWLEEPLQRLWRRAFLPAPASSPAAAA